MIEEPRIIQTADQHTAFLHLLVQRAEIQIVMGQGIHEVFSAVAAQGLAPTGPWFTHHLRKPTDTFDLEICVPIATPLTATDRVQPGRWPAMTVARTVYQGPYEGLAAAWGEFHEWMAANGHTPAQDLWERYLTGPESSTDPADWRTELNRPMIG